MKLQHIFLTALVSTANAAGLEKRQNPAALSSCQATMAASDTSTFNSAPTAPPALAAVADNSAAFTSVCTSGSISSQYSSFMSAVSSWSSANSAWISSQLAESSLCPAYSTALSEIAAAPTSLGSIVASACSAVTATASSSSNGGGVTSSSSNSGGSMNMVGYAGVAIAGAVGVVAML